jgi:RNA polymerase sigma factor (sigma-70 family)
LLGYARDIASDLGDTACEDIAVSAVRRAVHFIDRYDPAKGTFPAWARSQVRFAAMDYRRDNARLTELDHDIAEAPTELSRDIPQDIRAALQAAVRRLRGADQVILALCEVEGLSSQAASLRLGISADAARQRLSRARRRLAAEAQEDAILKNFVAMSRGRTS